MKTLIELYKSVLSSVGMVADNQGFVSTILPGSDTPKPFSVEGKRLVLPTDEQLAQPDWSNRIGFHPLLQNVSGGESRVMEKFRDRMNSYADFSLGMLLTDIAQLGVKKEMHKDLVPTQSAYLGPFSDADEKFVKLVRDLTITKRVSKKGFEFVRFSVIKGRAWQGQKRSRVAVMHFPLYEALPKDNKPTEILNHKLRIADVKMLRQMYEFLFKGIKEEGHYEVGSDSKIAPSLESLMAVYAKFVDVVNDTVTVLENVIGTSTALMIVNDWRADLEQVSKYLPEIRKIPLLEGNIPSERVAAALAPKHISDTPIQSAVKTVTAPADQTPVITAAVGQAISKSNQEVQQVQQSDQARPRFKLGVKSPLVSDETATHQISDSTASSLSSGLSYARPSAASTLAPTPPVGTLLQQQQQVQQPVAAPVFAQAAVQAQAQPVQAMKVPETARIINGALYIPLESSGVSAIPAGAVLVDGKTYIPLATMTGAAQPVQQAFQQNRFGVATQQAVTDPGQIPGLSQQEIEYYRANPLVFQNLLSQLQMGAMAQSQNVLQQRQTQAPRYLRNAVEQAQQNQFTTQGFFRR